MKLTANREQFLAAATFAAHPIKPRSTLPCLSCLKMDAKDGAVRITGSNLDSWAIGSCEAKVSDAGVALVPASLFIDLLSSASAEELTIETEENKAIVVSAGSITSKFGMIDPGEFPQQPPRTDSFSTVISSAHLRESIGSVIWAARDLETDLYCSVLLDVNEKYIRLCSTSGSSLAVRRIDTGTQKGDVRFVIPRSLAKIMHSALAGISADVTISANENSIALSFDGHSVEGKLMEGRYPNFDQVIPKEESIVHRFAVNREAMLSALSRSTLFNDERFFGAELAFKDGSLVVSCQNGLHSSRETIPCSPGTFSVRVNHKNVHSILAQIPSDEVTLEMIDELSPITVRCGAFLALTMPLRKG